tara:strand:- start:1620 stop:2102 length:483 start_codon:yes stop_codon:yes gene_type:complete
MKKLIRKILREELNKSDKYYRFLDKISSIIELPYFRNMYEKNNGGFWDITDRDDQEYIMKNIYGDDINIILLSGRDIYDENDNRVYWENSVMWSKWEYDDKDNEIYYERHNGFWEKQEYDDNGNEIYYESSEGYWEKREYDSKGNYMYYEDSDGDIMDNR